MREGQRLHRLGQNGIDTARSRLALVLHCAAIVASIRPLQNEANDLGPEFCHLTPEQLWNMLLTISSQQ
jgi:hypothetical protein